MKTEMAKWCVGVVVTLMLAVLTSDVGAADAECCSTCIGKTAPSVYDYDPLIYAQCAAKNVSRVCCFECGSMGDPTYGETISYASDGTTPTVKAGTWIKMQWSDINNVTYITLKENQKKTMTPTIGDTAATEKSGYFMICARSVGQIVFRGWGSDPCRQASPEKSLTILEGESGASCDAAEPTAPDTTTSSKSASSGSAGSGSADTSESECNQNRASIKVVNGVKECVCVSDWANPPACDQMPTWKWVVTIGGGVAALLSILISVRAFMKSREKKRLQDEDDAAMLGPRMGSRKEDVETLQITPDRRSNEIAAPYGRENNRAQSQPRKPDEREFTL